MRRDDLDDHGSIPGKGKNIPRHRVQTALVPYPASYPVGTAGL
jgi:hypothetical protein